MPGEGVSIGYQKVGPSNTMAREMQPECKLLKRGVVLLLEDITRTEQPLSRALVPPVMST